MRFLMIAGAVLWLGVHGQGGAAPGHGPGGEDRPSSLPAQAAQVPTGDAEAGERIYVSYGCYGCHGYAAQGGTAGPRLAQRLVPFAAFERLVRRPVNQMPPYTDKVLSDQEMVDIYTFLRSIPEPPSLTEIQLLQDTLRD